MAQTPKGRLIQGLYQPIHGTCAMYFYLGVPGRFPRPERLEFVDLEEVLC